VLVMKMWPRGISKDKVEVWIKELGADKPLIKAWKEGKIEWSQFKKEYMKSLKGKEEILDLLAGAAKKEKITLLCSCKDEKHCHRHLLKQALEKRG